MRTTDLIPPNHILRAVDMDSLDMTLLQDSIRKNGLLVPITVVGRIIVDGYRRWMICRALGWADVPTHEVTGDPVQLRVIAQTRHTEFGRTDKRYLVGDLLLHDPTLTAAKLAHDLQWSPVEVESLAGVEFLIPAFRTQYASGRLSLAEVWHVSRCRDGGQTTLIQGDAEEPIIDRARALHREARSQRRRSMTMRARGKGLDAVIRERDKPCEVGPELLRAGAVTAADGWRACLDWILASGK